MAKDSKPETKPQTEDRIRWKNPPTQRISTARVNLIKAIALVAAVALTVYDAYVSYQGFKILELPNHAPLVLALLILIVQLASGAIQQLGMNPFRGVGGSGFMDFLWIWVLASVYVIDVASNAIAFGVGRYTTWEALSNYPIGALVMIVSVLMLSCLLTFGDEILLRLVDRLLVGSRANQASVEKSEVDLKAYRRYLKGYEQRALNQAQKAGESASIDFSWLEQGGNE